MGSILPARHQRTLPLDRIIRQEPPGAEALEMDVLVVGGGPAGLACAIELATLARRSAEAGGALGELQIGVLEKAGSLGEHSLSGAVVNPRAFRELFPDTPLEQLPFRQPVPGEAVHFLTERAARRIPTPPTMHNAGFYTASLCEIVRWMGERAEALGVNIFPGFPAESLLVEGSAVRGVRTAATGLDRNGEPGSGYQEPTDITARITVLAEGTRGMLAQAWREWQQVSSPNPQIYALGVKEVWETSRPLDRVIHTLGWPLPADAFGGSFMYPLGPAQIAIGLVVGLDYHAAALDVHELLQRMKLHPLFRPYLEGGRLLEWGAKTIPEGGYHALLRRRYGEGIMLVGDSAGLVDVPSLKGIHYAMQSGMYAARTAFDALERGAAGPDALAGYDALVDESYIVSDLHRTRNMRLAFKDGLYVGGAKAALMTLTGGRFPARRIAMRADAQVPRRTDAPSRPPSAGDATASPPPSGEPPATFRPDGVLTFSKVDAVFKSGNATRDTIPSHLLVGPDVTGEVAEFYSHVCPAGVYERAGDELRVNAPNCVDCKATDILGPRWTPREGGSGPKYRLM
ncbi:MAG TPA: electron-transfer flavoprotein:ubiquinone oxidoreductase [Gemmatimonadales bacterium]|nr:electron-transfer flavoprotein:ubiquinone oxidoreductase [Gemmatimonadales bacterium]